jgi:hypothetical protein
MKQILFPIILLISLTLTSLWLGHKITSGCDNLIQQAADEEDSASFRENWESFSKFAAFITPYDLIRTADTNYSEYIALMEADADASDIDAARDVLIASIRQIRRIHSLDWELIF